MKDTRAIKTIIAESQRRLNTYEKIDAYNAMIDAGVSDDQIRLFCYGSFVANTCGFGEDEVDEDD